MPDERLTISQAAKLLGVSTRTIRRYIKSGKIRAELVSGTFGEEYQITELPSDLREKPVDSTTGQTHGQIVDIVRELQEKNLALAAQLGAATERIRNLEGQVKLLTAARQPWWKRLLRRG